ncbi:MAG: ATP synthase F1 subunit delta, partial [Pseudomonadota bacterium]
MSEPASISNGISGRYATALFDLAKEEKTLPRLEKDVATLSEAIAASEDLSNLISSPIYTRVEMQAAITAVATKIGLGDKLTNTLALMAQNRRLFVVPQLITGLRALIAEHKGEVTAEVVSA